MSRPQTDYPRPPRRNIGLGTRGPGKLERAMAEVKQEGLKQGGDVSSSVLVEGAVEESSQSTPIEKFANVRCVDMMSQWRHCIGQ